MTDAAATGRPCVLISTGPEGAARRAAALAGLEPHAVLSKGDCARRLASVRRGARDAGVDVTVIHSPDWERQRLPHLFELAAARLALPEALLIGDDGVLVDRRTRGDSTRRALAAPGEAAAGLALAAAEAAHFERARRRPAPPASGRAFRPGDTVLAVWEGSPGTSVGGSVTHIAGVLAGFRSAGLRVELLTSCDPPAQLAGVVDDVEVVAAPPPASRVTNEVTSICANRFGRRAVAARARPGFVYQRYDPFIWHGIEAADAWGVPSVLEWNSSEVWTRANWHRRHPVKQLFDPFARAIERHVVARASLVAAVSAHAAGMARAAGAGGARLAVVPNGVDVDEVDAALAGSLPPSSDWPPLVGWVGTFGSWHGAEVLVRALAALPAGIGAVMVGDGPGREECRRLAAELGVVDRIEWTGLLPHDEAVRRLGACDVLASPHVPLSSGQAFFGSPTKLFEYMAIGRPIVASALEQIGEVLEDGRTAVLVPPGDPEALARAIARVVGTEDRGRSLGAAAREEAILRHTWDERARAILAHLAGEPVRRPVPVGA
jgi:glycosyltransferase involved in cell wall biosynthesis